MTTKRGTYTLVLARRTDATVAFGAAGERILPAGGYAYTGSAFGPGGFTRIDRHRELAAGEREARHWHVDYLLGRAGTTVLEAVRTPGADVECAVARALAAAGEPIDGIGASDCDCGTHLVHMADVDALRAAARRAHERAREGE